MPEVKVYGMDASAMVAYLRNEPGADVVRRILRDPANLCYAHALNLCRDLDPILPLGLCRVLFIR